MIFNRTSCSFSEAATISFFPSSFVIVSYEFLSFGASFSPLSHFATSMDSSFFICMSSWVRSIHSAETD